MRFIDWVFDYYTVYKAMSLKLNTIKVYLWTAKKHIPQDWIYEDITCIDIQKLINDLVLAGLSPSSVKHIFTVIREPLLQGVFYGLPDKRSAVVGISLPVMNHKKVNALSHDDLQKIIMFDDNSIMTDCIRFLIYTGLRSGEVLALTQKDVDFDNNFININKSIYNGVITSPKTKTSNRIVPCSSLAMNILVKRFNFNRDVPIFNFPYRKLLNHYKSICEALNIKSSGLHALRHSYATELFANGVDLKIISSLLGHSSVSITADIYTDLDFNTKYKAVCSVF